MGVFVKVLQIFAIKWNTNVILDIDECTNNNYPCDPNARCTNTHGSFTCECFQWFESNGTACVDTPQQLYSIGSEIRRTLHHAIPSSRPAHRTRLLTQLRKLFDIFFSQMQQCRNGDKTVTLQPKRDTNTFIKDQWMTFFRRSFNMCDLPIIRKNRTFDGTNWPNRINNYFIRLNKYEGRK